jgi:hypothetical protein
MHPGFFDHEDQLTKLEKLGDPLPRLDSIVDWAAFRPLLKVIHQKQRKSNAGRKPHDVALMFKMLVLQALYNPVLTQRILHSWLVDIPLRESSFRAHDGGGAGCTGQSISPIPDWPRRPRRTDEAKCISP